MTDPLRLLGANIRVAANLREHDEQEAREAAWVAAWDAMAARAAAVGCRLQACRLDPACDGECGCAPGLFDRNGKELDLYEDSSRNEIDALICQLEASGGIAP